LGSAFWALLNTNSFEEGLVEIVNRGDDADTCGAVTGALLGAFYGIDQIPHRWLEVIKQRKHITKLLASSKISK